MNEHNQQPSASEWSEEQTQELRKVIESRRASRRSFLRHGLLSTAALGTVLVLSPQEARAQGSGY